MAKIKQLNLIAGVKMLRIGFITNFINYKLRNRGGGVFSISYLLITFLKYLSINYISV